MLYWNEVQRKAVRLNEPVKYEAEELVLAVAHGVEVEVAIALGAVVEDSEVVLFDEIGRHADDEKEVEVDVQAVVEDREEAVRQKVEGQLQLVAAGWLGVDCGALRWDMAMELQAGLRQLEVEVAEEEEDPLPLD